MYVNCPLINQRTQIGTDGRAPEDGNMDCVPASLASMASALLDTAQNADAYHDQVYGQGYVGMQDPARYVGLLASLGLTLTCYTGTPSDLIAHAVACIRNREPVLLSIPSDWNDNPPTSGYAHMVAGCDVNSSAGPSADQTTLTAMNPWTAAYQTQSLAWWQERLATCAYKAAWVMTKAEGTSVWHQQSDGSGKDDAGHACGAGIMGYLTQHGLTGSDGLLSETYYSGAHCALPLANGRIVTASPSGPNGAWVMDEEGAQAFVSVWQQLQAARSAPPAPPTDPTAAPLRAALAAFLAQKSA